MIRRISLVVVITLFSLALFIAPAQAQVNEIVVDPSTIQMGQSVTITLTTPLKTTGTVTVTDPNGDSWTSSIAINIPSGGGSQSWIFPDDFPSGASTYILGLYIVVADLTMEVDGGTWITQSSSVFVVENHNGRIGGELVSVDTSSAFLSRYWLLIILLFVPLVFVVYKRRYSLLVGKTTNMLLLFDIFQL